MCAHETPQEAARCQCTGYGFGDPPCRCGYPKSQHADGTGPCLIPAARCHEFVLHIDDPFPVTLALVQAAADALMAELGFKPLAAQRAAMSALFAGRAHAVDRDYEIRSVRAQNDRLRKQLTRADKELDALRAALPQKEDVQPHDQTA
jgi:hypothetical protein